MKVQSKVRLFILFIFLTSFRFQGTIPDLNLKIVEYVNSVIGKKVDRGECWDLACEALNKNNADWDGKFKYGIRIDPKKDEIFPGDLIQFEGVQIKYTVGNTITTEFMEHHTAIVFKVYEKGKFQLAHQNTGFSGKKVGLSDMNIDHIIRGKILFYRPKAK